jgi:outer membrane PBP1 activator LpoA protein
MDTRITRRGGADRLNTHLAPSVDHALALAMEQDARAAAHFLEEQGIGFALTCCVLAEPGRRRVHALDLPPDRS